VTRGRGARGADFARGRGARGAGHRPRAPLPTLGGSAGDSSPGHHVNVLATISVSFFAAGKNQLGAFNSGVRNDTHDSDSCH
jgi:hypothetical protein